MKLLLLVLLLTGCTIVEDSELYCRTRQRCNCGKQIELDQRYPSHIRYGYNEPVVDFRKSQKNRVPIYEYEYISPLYEIRKTGRDADGDPVYNLIETRKGEHRRVLKGYKYVE